MCLELTCGNLEVVLRGVHSKSVSRHGRAGAIQGYYAAENKFSNDFGGSWN